MTHRIKSLLVAALLSVTAGHGTVAHSQHFGAGGPAPAGGGRVGPPSGGPPSTGAPGRPVGPGGMSGGDRLPGTGFVRDRAAPPDSLPDRDREVTPGPPPEMARVVPLNDAVSMVQDRFNATAVKTDTVNEDGHVTYRIRLLSADKSRVWTVNVNAHTGQMN